MVRVTLQVGEGYVDELLKRMKSAGITGLELSETMAPPVPPSQMSRWLTRNRERRVMPNLVTVERIEKAMEKLTRKRGK